METYDDDKSLQFAEILKEKAEKKAKEEGQSTALAVEAGKSAFNTSRRRQAIDFLKTIKDKIDKLSNQEIAKLLNALIALGLSIEDEEELEYWINLLEKLSMQRMADYFVARNGVDEHGKFNKPPNHIKKILTNTRGFTSEDLEAFVSILGSMQKVMEKKFPKNKEGAEYKKFLEKEKFIKKLEKVIKKDLGEKKKHEKEQNKQKQKNKPEKPEEKIDTLGILKGKMLSSGVESGGEYWSSVISDHDATIDKVKFVQDWTKDSSKEKELSQKIQELRGIKTDKDKSENKQNGQEQQKSNQNSQTGNQGNSGGR